MAGRITRREGAALAAAAALAASLPRPAVPEVVAAPLPVPLVLEDLTAPLDQCAVDALFRIMPECLDMLTLHPGLVTLGFSETAGLPYRLVEEILAVVEHETARENLTGEAWKAEFRARLVSLTDATRREVARQAQSA